MKSITAGIAQLVERNFAKVKAIGSRPITRSKTCGCDEIGRLPVLRSPGSKERAGSSPVTRTNINYK